MDYEYRLHVPEEKVGKVKKVFGEMLSGQAIASVWRVKPHFAPGDLPRTIHELEYWDDRDKKRGVFQIAAENTSGEIDTYYLKQYDKGSNPSLDPQKAIHAIREGIANAEKELGAEVEDPFVSTLSTKTHHWILQKEVRMLKKENELTKKVSRRIKESLEAHGIKPLDYVEHNMTSHGVPHDIGEFRCRKKRGVKK